MSFKWIILILALICVASIAQESDSITTHSLTEVTVQSNMKIEPKPPAMLDQKFLTSFDGKSIYETGYFIPSTKPQTNSRGESLFYIRGSNERQLGLFFDGAFINIPWDNRIDLSLLPTNSISELKIIKGIPSVTFGVNNVAGVIIASSPKNFTSQLSGNVAIQFGDFNQRKLSVSIGKRVNDFSIFVSASHYNRDSYTLPKHFHNSENPSRERMNSYQQSNDLFLKIGYDYKKSSNINVSIQHINSEKGVPPEIGVSKPRYWQYPTWNKISFNITGKHNFDTVKNSYIDYVLNIYHFKMQINDFNDRTFSQISDIEKDNDVVVYGKALYTKLASTNSILRFSLSGYHTNHKENFMTSGFIEELFIQNVFSTGAEYEYLWNSFSVILGLGLDGTLSSELSFYKEKKNLSSPAFFLTAQHFINSDLSIQFNLGRKSRFPSLRESFSDGLGRFIINPNLKPETANEGEFGIKLLLPHGVLYSNIFLNLLENGVVRDVIKLDEVNKFKRINKSSILSYGIEAQINYNFFEKIHMDFQISYMHSNAKNDITGEFKDTLEYKPEFISSLYLHCPIFKTLSGLLEISMIHNEYGYEEGYEFFKKLPPYFLMNLRFTYDIRLSDIRILQFFARINNIFDKLYYTQWGLPEAGRQFYIGIGYKF